MTLRAQGTSRALDPLLLEEESEVNMEKERKQAHLPQMSRREFIQSSVKATAGLALGLPSLERMVPTVAGDRRPRVVRSYDAGATSWDYQSNYYFDFIDQSAINRMFLQGVRALTGAGSDRKAWTRLLGGYGAGGKVAIKINCNNYADLSNQIDATAPSINAVLLGLIEILGVAPENIYIYDCSRPIPSRRVRERVLWGVNYVQNGDSLAQADHNAPIEFRNIGTQYCPYVLTQADHLIDLCLFKDHLIVLATMGFKNHLGTTRPGPSYLHTPIDQNLSDLNATPQIREKTRLIVGDALWGVYTGGPGGWPQQWSTFPGGPTPNSLFLGQDPVAVESVMIDYLIAEQEYHGIPLLSHEYLHDAMTYHRLGVHEHRDAQGYYQNIDYVELDLGVKTLGASSGIPATR